jgi:hypothetical protein
MSTALVSPAKMVNMIAKGAPHVIHNDEELEAYTEVLFQLTAKDGRRRTQHDRHADVARESNQCLAAFSDCTDPHRPSLFWRSHHMELAGVDTVVV